MAAGVRFAAAGGWLQFGMGNDECRPTVLDSRRESKRQCPHSGSGAGRTLREREVDRGHMAQVERNGFEMRRYDGHRRRK